MNNKKIFVCVNSIDKDLLSNVYKTCQKILECSMFKQDKKNKNQICISEELNKFETHLEDLLLESIFDNNLFDKNFKVEMLEEYLIYSNYIIFKIKNRIYKIDFNIPFLFVSVNKNIKDNTKNSKNFKDLI